MEDLLNVGITKEAKNMDRSKQALLRARQKAGKPCNVQKKEDLVTETFHISRHKNQNSCTLFQDNISKRQNLARFERKNLVILQYECLVDLPID